MLWAYLQGSLHCRKKLKIFPACICTGIAPVLLIPDNNYHKFWWTLGFFSWYFIVFVYLFHDSSLKHEAPWFGKQWSSVKVNAWDCTSTVRYVVLVWCFIRARTTFTFHFLVLRMFGHISCHGQRFGFAFYWLSWFSLHEWRLMFVEACGTMTWIGARNAKLNCISSDTA